MTHDLQPNEPTNNETVEQGCGDGAHTAPAAAPAAAGHPPLVIRGESPWIGQDEDTGERAYVVPTGKRGGVRLVPIPVDGVSPYAAITDWLNFTFPRAATLQTSGKLFRLLLDTLGTQFGPITPLNGRRFCYEHPYALGTSGAILAIGGNRNTGLVSFSGEACALIDDWQKVVTLGRDEFGGKVTRWDGAVDDYAGAHSVDYALDLYLANAFGTGGRAPQMQQKGNWARPDGRGRSIVIGARENGKRLQVYEKGMQLGTPWHPWTRWEVTLGNEGRVIPWETLLEPGRFVVGAYPKPLGWVQKEMSRIATLQKQTRIGYEVLTYSAKLAYGRHINYMLSVEGTAEKVVERLRRSGIPRRLDHPACPDIEAADD